MKSKIHPVFDSEGRALRLRLEESEQLRVEWVNLAIRNVLFNY